MCIHTCGLWNVTEDDVGVPCDDESNNNDGDFNGASIYNCEFDGDGDDKGDKRVSLDKETRIRRDGEPTQRALICRIK